jgi:hypothetical protein
VLNLGDRQPGVLLVQPDGVVAAVQADQFHQLRVAQLPQGKNSGELPLPQPLFQA